MVAAKWKTMRPETAKTLSMAITAAGVGIIWRTFDPEGWKPIGAILAYWWVIFPAGIAYIFIEVFLMDKLGKRDDEGKAEQYVDPLERRLEAIEAAINRLHDYVREIDPELAEELRLEREFMSGTGGMFAGYDHLKYVEEREATGLRTRHSSIWRDREPPEPSEFDEGEQKI